MLADVLIRNRLKTRWGRSGEFAYTMTHFRWLFPVISCKHKLWTQN